MNRVLSIIGVGAVTALLGAGSVTAASADPQEEYPESEGWYYVEDVIRIPAGTVCKAPITIKARGHQRDIVNGSTDIPEDYVPQPGDRLIAEAGDDQRITVINRKNGRRVTKDNSGDFYDKVKRNGTDLKSKGVGANTYFGPGVKGILWTNGVQKFTVEDFMDNGGVLHIHKIRGKAVDLCHKVGTKPVPGKPIPEPSQPA